MMYLNEFLLAQEVAVEVGQFLKNQAVKEVISSKERDIKLALDRQAEQMIFDNIQSKSIHSILSEESGLQGELEDRIPYWVIDPIDGTMNYSRDFPIACVSIAFWIEKEPLFGVVYDFYRDELFTGLVGEGAWLNRRPLSPPNKAYDISQAILATGIPTYLKLDDEKQREFVRNIFKYKKVRMIGSAALSLCYVACGRVDSYREENIKFWDIAAGIAINKSLDVKTSVRFVGNYNTITLAGV